VWRGLGVSAPVRIASALDDGSENEVCFVESDQPCSTAMGADEAPTMT